MSEHTENTMLDDSHDQSTDPSRPQCAVCFCLLPLTRAGLVRVHGPVGNQCPGSCNRPTLPPEDLSREGQAADSPLRPVFDTLRSIAEILKKIQQLPGCTT